MAPHIHRPITTPEFDSIRDFGPSVGLSVTFKTFGIHYTKDNGLRHVAGRTYVEGKVACNTNGVIKTDYAFSATKAADAAGRDCIRETRWKKNWRGEDRDAPEVCETEMGGVD